jgi:hypothetical protein
MLILKEVSAAVMSAGIVPMDGKTFIEVGIRIRKGIMPTSFARYPESDLVINPRLIYSWTKLMMELIS